MSKILITGGAGYIGSVLAIKLIKEGHDVVIYDSFLYENHISLSIIDDILDNNISISEGLLKDYKEEEFKNFKLIEGDTRDNEKLKEVFSENKFDFVFHFAELVGHYICERNPVQTKEINFEGTKNIVDLASEKGSVLIYNSSSSVYGSREDPSLVLDEEGELFSDGLDNYCINKILSEKYIVGKENPNFKYVIFRPATVGGLSPRMRLTLLPNHFTYAGVIQNSLSLTEGNNYRAVIDVNDLTDAYMAVVNSEEIHKGIFNIGSYNMTKQEYLDGISKVIDTKMEIKAIGKVANERNMQISSEKFKKYYNFEASTSFEDMIKPLVELLRKNPEVFSKNNFKGVLNTNLEEWKMLLS